MSALTSITVTAGLTKSIALAPSTIAIKVSNKSYFDIQYSDFGAQGQDWIASGVEVMLDGTVSNNGKLTVTAVNSDNINNPPSGTLLINEFLEGEDLPKGSWPVSIPKSSVTALNTIASLLQNIGQVPGTVVEEIQPNGDTGFTYTLDNKGNWALGDTMYPGTWSIDNAFIKSTGLGQLLMQDTGNDLLGTTAGRVRIIQPFQGLGFKVLFCTFIGYNNTTATQQTISLPNTFIEGAFFWIGGITNLSASGVFFMNGSSAQKTNYTKNGVTTTNNSAVNPNYSVGEVLGGFNSISISASLTGANGIGNLIVIGQ